MTMRIYINIYIYINIVLVNVELTSIMGRRDMQEEDGDTKLKDMLKQFFEK